MLGPAGVVGQADDGVSADRSNGVQTGQEPAGQALTISLTRFSRNAGLTVLTIMIGDPLAPEHENVLHPKLSELNNRSYRHLGGA